MGSHHLAYIPRRVVRLALAAPRMRAAGLDALAPSGHATSASAFAERVRADDVIWFFSSIRYANGWLAPAIDARFRVLSDPPHEQRRRTGRKHFIVAAPEETEFFPWRDATNLLHRLRDPQGKRLVEGTSGVSEMLLRFQVPRTLDASSGRELEKQATLARESSRTVFVSYSWRNSTQRSREVVAQLGRSGFNVWWDRWCMPRRLAEGRVQVAASHLATWIVAGMTRSSIGICLDPKPAAIAKWARWEVELLRKRQRRDPSFTLFEEMPQHLIQSVAG
jgi:hypothetical protein